MLEDKDFELVEETPVNENTEVEEKITADDFTLTEVDSSVHEQKFQTKPTTFLKDSLKRFRKNKSSVVAAGTYPRTVCLRPSAAAADAGCLSVAATD